MPGPGHLEPNGPPAADHLRADPRPPLIGLLRQTGRTSEADKMEARAKAIRMKRAKENK